MRRLTVAVVVLLLGSGVTGCVIGGTDASSGARTARVTTDSPASDARADEEGLHVEGLVLSAGVSQAKMLDSLGTEDERYPGETDTVYYVWELDDGTRLSCEFDEVGSLRSATLAVPDSGTANAGSYALLGGKRVIPGKTTLGEVMRWFPEGELGEVLPGEGFSLVDYTVSHGPEASETMQFGVGWEWGDSMDRTLDQQRAMALSSVSVE